MPNSELDQLLEDLAVLQGSETAPDPPAETPAITPVEEPIVSNAPPSQPVPKSGNGMLIVGVLFLSGMGFLFATVLAVLLLWPVSGGSDGGDSDDERPSPDSQMVIDGFDLAATNYMNNMGDGFVELGERTKDGDFKTTDAWAKATREVFTAAEDEFLRETGEWDNKYVPAGLENDDELEDGKLTSGQQKRLGDYTIFSGEGLKQAVSK